MRINVTRVLGISVLAVGIAVSGMPVRAAITAQDQDRTDQQRHDHDYSSNKNYQLGMRDGRDDRAHNRDHSKKHHFKKDEDQKAYDAGYEEGRRGGDQPDRH